MFRVAKDKGTHYQIINHRLYRTKECIFEFRYVCLFKFVIYTYVFIFILVHLLAFLLLFQHRCRGIEHFLMKLIKRLPNMEFVINCYDWPQASTRGPPVPVFSFSKVVSRNVKSGYRGV
jgi:protein glucosyltransferase